MALIETAIEGNKIVLTAPEMERIEVCEDWLISLIAKFPLTGVTTDERDETAQREVAVFNKKCVGIDEVCSPPFLLASGSFSGFWFGWLVFEVLRCWLSIGSLSLWSRYQSYLWVWLDFSPMWLWLICRLENAPNSLGFADEFPFLLISEASVTVWLISFLPLFIFRILLHPSKESLLRRRTFVRISLWKAQKPLGKKRNGRNSTLVEVVSIIWSSSILFLSFLFAYNLVKLSSPKPCKRCILTTVNPEEGTMSETKEPFKTIFKKRNERGMFGITLMHNSDALGTILMAEMLTLIQI